VDALKDHRSLALTLVATFVPGADHRGAGLEHAIRTELLIVALQDYERPRTLAELERVLERISFGDIATELLAAVREFAEREPNLLLTGVAEHFG
jgi:hypothetical protein